ncbi:MAG: ATP-grasp domain-containing protein [Deltaproteobacteria bacterium]|nr:ATP-grasp domain-containing protein [Deltaproteobacteria bacterium]
MKKLLIANRGEIAVRIIRAARSLGLKTVALYSDPDAESLHVRLADERIHLGGSAAKETYLDQDKIISALVLTGADAVHPGYGFLAENAGFARRVREAGAVFVGPSPEVIALMGDKEQARKKAIELQIPVVPGAEVTDDTSFLAAEAQRIGYPVIFKAVAGGSGRGMRIVRTADELAAKFQEARDEALAGFGNAAVFLEKFLESPRHIEVQIFGDSFGNIVCFGERECSLQRRHQKLVEEAPAPNLHESVRARLHVYAVRLGKECRYESSGTLEFLVDGGTTADSPIYFLEMNTRIQVEHPVTESVYGVDLVRLQLEVAQGKSLDAVPAPQCTGHSIEYRVYAEDPSKGFSPMMGQARYISRPGGPGLREDGWAESGTKISPYYDSLLFKAIVTAPTREEALRLSKVYLDEYVVEGFETTLGFHRWVLTQPDFVRGLVDVYWISRNYDGTVVSAPRATSPFVLPPPRQSTPPVDVPPKR